MAEQSQNAILNLLSSLVTQFKAALVVGISDPDDLERRFQGNDKSSGTRRRSWRDFSGRMTRNGLGSLDIGAGRSRIGE